jgi:hypothetical protein
MIETENLTLYNILFHKKVYINNGVLANSADKISFIRRLFNRQIDISDYVELGDIIFIATKGG